MRAVPLNVCVGPFELEPPGRGGEGLRTLYDELVTALRDGLIGTPAAAQIVLEFAALATKQYAVESDSLGDERCQANWAAMLTMVLHSYERSRTISLASVEALRRIWHCSAGGVTRHQLGVSIFQALAESAENHAQDDWPEVHGSLLTALGETASVEATDWWTPSRDTEATYSMDVGAVGGDSGSGIAGSGVIKHVSCNVVEYALQQLDLQRGSLPREAVEGALMLLGVCGQTYRLVSQIRICLDVLRSFRSDEFVAAQSLVTIGELYDVLSAETVVGAKEGPPLGDVDLVAGMVGLCLNARKVVGAALRALSSMARSSLSRRRAVLVDRSRDLVLAQQRHPRSHSVNFHLADIVRVAAAQSPDLVDPATLLLAIGSLLNFPRDADIVSAAVEAVSLAVLYCQRKETSFPLIDLLPVDKILYIGEEHRCDARIVIPMCELLRNLAESDVTMRMELVRRGAIAVPFRALAVNGADQQGIAIAASRAVQAFARLAPETLPQIVRLRGSPLLVQALKTHYNHPSVVQEVLAALKVIVVEPAARGQIMLAEDAELSCDIVLRSVQASSSSSSSSTDESKVLEEAVGLIEVLTSHDDSSIQLRLREAVDWDLIEQLGYPPEEIAKLVPRPVATSEDTDGGWAPPSVDPEEIVTGLQESALLASSVFRLPSTIRPKRKAKPRPEQRLLGTSAGDFVADAFLDVLLGEDDGT
eukprot:TRINITY_DN12765_c0_g1_i1.p1 TRINITY_DN12765_c0_g1~~TRINITY_DN12765_c0_g1_i1.p1  ORF type:complete len:705 (-),score=130.08 TRINITY_DN12765_c0_g1_i1:17-2131(-)